MVGSRKINKAYLTDQKKDSFYRVRCTGYAASWNAKTGCVYEVHWEIVRVLLASATTRFSSYTKLAYCSSPIAQWVKASN